MHNQHRQLQQQQQQQFQYQQHSALSTAFHSKPTPPARRPDGSLVFHGAAESSSAFTPNLELALKSSAELLHRELGMGVDDMVAAAAAQNLESQSAPSGGTSAQQEQVRQVVAPENAPDSSHTRAKPRDPQSRFQELLHKHASKVSKSTTSELRPQPLVTSHHHRADSYDTNSILGNLESEDKAWLTLLQQDRVSPFARATEKKRQQH
jgi:hypothetical protein